MDRDDSHTWTVRPRNVGNKESIVQAIEDDMAANDEVRDRTEFESGCHLALTLATM
jgi:hypothetical protein